MRVSWVCFTLSIVVLTGIVHLSGVTYAESTAFPPFPRQFDQDYPTDSEGLSDLSDAGDGYATLRLFMEQQRCSKGEITCESTSLELLRLAVEQGESVANPYLRIADIERGEHPASESELGRATCGMTLDDLPRLSQSVTSLEFPIADYMRARDESLSGSEEWQIAETIGSEGSRGVLFNTSAVWIVFIFNEGDLRNVRLTINLLALGGEAQGDSAMEIAKSVATAVCPTWIGLGNATERYLRGAASSWPPRGIHVEGESAWLAVFGVMPDILWFDLYTDPSHQPFESTFREQFDVSPDVHLRGYTSVPSTND